MCSQQLYGQNHLINNDISEKLLRRCWHSRWVLLTPPLLCVLHQQAYARGVLYTSAIKMVRRNVLLWPGVYKSKASTLLTLNPQVFSSISNLDWKLNSSIFVWNPSSKFFKPFFTDVGSRWVLLTPPLWCVLHQQAYPRGALHTSAITMERRECTPSTACSKSKALTD